jgi:hypothetical protein
VLLFVVNAILVAALTNVGNFIAIFVVVKVVMFAIYLIVIVTAVLPCYFVTTAVIIIAPGDDIQIFI